jgi:hypothetical protein
MFNFLTQKIQYHHKYEAVPTKTYKAVNKYVLNYS